MFNYTSWDRYFYQSGDLATKEVNFLFTALRE